MEQKSGSEFAYVTVIKHNSLCMKIWILPALFFKTILNKNVKYLKVLGPQMWECTFLN